LESASKNPKYPDKLRPLNEAYIPVPIEFHRKNPSFFTKNILPIIEERNKLKGVKNVVKPEVRFILQLPTDNLCLYYLLVIT
jgi:hypothetical protein